MANQLFDEFVDRLASSSHGQNAASTTVKDEWLQGIETFYRKVQSFLKDYVEQNKVAISFAAKTIVEPHIGQYVTRDMVVRIGSSEIRFEPIGARLIGSRGRIDMLGPNGLIRFLLVDKEVGRPRASGRKITRVKEDHEIDWVWKIATEPPNVEYYDLNEDSFLEALMAVANA